jgi:hypothetical protein
MKKVNFTLEQALKTQSGNMCSFTLSLTATLGGSGRPTTHPRRFTPGKDSVPIVQVVGWAYGPVWTGAERLSTHCTGGWVGLRPGLDGGGKSRPLRNLITGPYRPQQVVIPIALSRPAAPRYVYTAHNLLFSHGWTTLVGISISCEVPRSHSDTSHPVGLLWTSDRPDEVTFT